LKVRAWENQSLVGENHFFTLGLYEDNIDPMVFFIHPEDSCYLLPGTVTLSISADDSESGISKLQFLADFEDWQNSDWIILEYD